MGNRVAPAGSHIVVALIVTIAALAAATCGGDPPPLPVAPTPTGALPTGGPCGSLGGTAILNGTECSPATSSVVLLNARDRNNFAVGACSGTVITPRAVLTAAHCLGGEAAIVRVWLGPPNQEIVARSYVSHPQYQGTGASHVDVGVVFMDQDLPRTPIPLLLSRDARVGEAAVIAGWGRDLSNVPATLRAGVTTITGVSATRLETIFASNVASVCSGDSGGPILLSQDGVWVIGGVISATSDTACNTGTNFYISIRNPTISSFVTSQVPDVGRR